MGQVEDVRAVGPLRLGTRASLLARAQTAIVLDRLASLAPPVEALPVSLRSEGDRRDAPLSAFGVIGVFTRELEAALRRGQVDALVHSLKDLPVVLDPDMALAAVLERDEPRDAAVTRDGTPLSELAPGSRIGTSSPRRRALLARAYPHLRAVEIRGNIDTRLSKLDDGVVDGLIVALAGLRRVGVERTHEALPTDVFLPAPGQGAIALETLADSPEALIVSRLDDRATRLATAAERAFERAFGAGCDLPLGAHAVLDGDHLYLRGVIFDASGRERLGERSGPAEDGPAVALELARELGA